MISTPTVFILGAGASRPYHFPTGPELVDRICQSPSDEFAPFGVDEKAFQSFVNELRSSDHPSVDAFLAHRKEFEDVGKKAIAYKLIECEKDDTLSKTKDWY